MNHDDLDPQTQFHDGDDGYEWFLIRDITTSMVTTTTMNKREEVGIAIVLEYRFLYPILRTCC